MPKVFNRNFEMKMDCVDSLHFFKSTKSWHLKIGCLEANAVSSLADSANAFGDYIVSRKNKV